MTSDFLMLSVKRRAEIMIALACRACGIPVARLSEPEAEPVILQARQLAAWLMRARAEVSIHDTAAVLGVEAQFVNATCFTVRQRLAARGARIDGSDDEIAERVRRLLIPAWSASSDDALPLTDCLMAVTLAFGLSRAEMTSLARRREATRARQCFCWLASIASTAEPKQIGRAINRGRSVVSYGIDIVAGAPGIATLRDEILVALAAGRPGEAALLAIGQRLEVLTRPATVSFTSATGGLTP